MKKEIKTLPNYFVVFPVMAIVFQILSIVFGALTNPEADTRSWSATWFIIANGFSIISMVFALVGAIKRTKNLYIIGSGISFIAGFLSVITIFVISISYDASKDSVQAGMYPLFVISFVFLMITSVLLVIASIITGAKKKGSYSFLTTTTIINFVIFLGFTIISFIMLLGLPYFRFYALFSEASFIVIFLSLIILGFIRHPENEIEDDIKPTIIIANTEVNQKTKEYLESIAKEDEKLIESKKDEKQVDEYEELKKYKKMLDDGLITPEDYENKKKIILK